MTDYIPLTDAELSELGKWRFKKARNGWGRSDYKCSNCGEEGYVVAIA